MTNSERLLTYNNEETQLQKKLNETIKAKKELTQKILTTAILHYPNLSDDNYVSYTEDITEYITANVAVPQDVEIQAEVKGIGSVDVLVDSSYLIKFSLKGNKLNSELFLDYGCISIDTLKYISEICDYITNRINEELANNE